MQQVKLFKSIETEVRSLEREINDWLRQSNARIVHVTGNMAPQTMSAVKSGTSGKTFESSDVFVAIVYETP